MGDLDLNEAAAATSRLSQAVDQLEASLLVLEERLDEAERFHRTVSALAADRDALAEALAQAEQRLSNAETDVRDNASAASADAAKLLATSPMGSATQRPDT